jgi:hypothetical protein
MRGAFDVDFIIAMVFFVAVYANLYVALPTLISTFRVNTDSFWSEAVYLSDTFINTAGEPKNWSEGGAGFAGNYSGTPNPCTIFWSNGSKTSCVATLQLPDGYYHGMTSIDNMTLKFPVTSGAPNNTFLRVDACGPVSGTNVGIYVTVNGTRTLVESNNYAACGVPINFHTHTYDLSSYLPDSNNEYNVSINGTTAYYDFATLNTTLRKTLTQAGFAYYNTTTRPCILDRSKVVTLANMSCDDIEGASDVLFDFKVMVSTFKENITCTTALPKYTKLVERACYLREDEKTYTPARLKLWVW